MRALPPLDTHAHVAPAISSEDLEHLGAVVLVATRSLADYQLVRDRSDLVTIWGVGCHPSLVGAQRAYSSSLFKQHIETSPYVAEVGLDGSSRVPIEVQTTVLESMLTTLCQRPRIVSLHSFKATAELISLLHRIGNVRSPIMHWWLGDPKSTQDAIDLGCYFSVNYSMLRDANLVDTLPLNRILLETDHPAGDRFSSTPRQPGSVRAVEEVLAKRFRMTPAQVRNQVWRNFSDVVKNTGCRKLLPKPVQAMIDYVDS